MKPDEAKKIADKQLERLAEALKQGKSEALKSYLSAVARLHKYSFRNLLLIFSQRPDASYVAGFNTWKKLGRWVKKGEKGVVIIVPLAVRRADSQSGTLVNEDKEFDLRFKASYVFDVSQTEGEPFAAFAEVQGNPGEHTDKIKALLAEKQIKLEYANDLGSADGVSKGGCIVLKEGLSPSTEFSVLVHELAHELLHQGASRKLQAKRVRETEAEAVAYVVSEAIGLSTNSACSDYIQLYQGDAESLKESLDAIHHAATTILSAVLPEEQ